MTEFEKDQEVMDLVNRNRHNQPVGYLVGEDLARDLASKEQQNQQLSERISALTAHNDQLAEQIQEEQERKIFRRKVLLPVTAGASCAAYLLGTLVGWMEPGFAFALAAPLAVAGMLPFAPWHREDDPHEA